MSYNLYKLLRALFPGARLQIGTVAAVTGGSVTVALPDGTATTAIGVAEVGNTVYIRDGRVEGEAPTLAVIEIEV